MDEASMSDSSTSAPPKSSRRKKEKRTFTEFRVDSRKALRHLPPAMGLVWQADRKTASLMALLTLVSAFLPLAQAYLGRWIVDSVVFSIETKSTMQEGLSRTLPYLTGEFALLLTGVLVTQFRRWAEQILDHKMSFSINTRIIRKALRLDLHYFENSEFYDKMQNARKQSEYRAVAIMNAGFFLVQNLLTIASFAAVILAFNPWIALILLGATVPAFIAQTRYSRMNFRLQSWAIPEARRVNYYEHLLTVDASAKEIKLFDLGEPLLKRHSDLFWNIFREDQKLAWRRSWASVAWGSVASLSFYGCYAWVIMRTVAATITLGQMTFYLASFRQLQGTFTGIFDNVAKLFENGLFMQNLFEFLELPEPEVAAAGSSLEPTVEEKYEGVEFRNVSFRYPDQTTWAVRNVSLHVRPGEKIALVGENGSGKTTFVKLLTRLYDPTEGEIFLYGRPLASYPREELHRKLGVIFQDFVRYQLTLKENVGFGSIEHIDDQVRLDRAVHDGGAQDVVDAVPDKWNTMLGGWFQKGRELSGGQWQKIALSRALMRDSEIIILDEPTSALDAAKEFEIFQRFKGLTRDKIAFLISHRFSTVRMADRIVVLHLGEIEELGTHEELMRKPEGTYARLFELQAEGYR